MKFMEVFFYLFLDNIILFDVFVNIKSLSKVEELESSVGDEIKLLVSNFSTFQVQRRLIIFGETRLKPTDKHQISQNIFITSNGETVLIISFEVQ